MTVQEAYKEFRHKKSELTIMSCYEYESCFVFHAVPPEFATPEKAAAIFDSLYSVNKETGSISTFRPLDLPVEERKRGRHLPIYDKV